MKCLLVAVNAKYIHSNPALYSLRAYARDYRKHNEIVEYTINSRTESILADIYKRKPDVVAFSCYIWNWEIIKELIQGCAEIMPDIPIWLGGPEVSYDAQEIMKEHPSLTGIMLGEGEETFAELMRHYVDQNRELKDILGIITAEGMNPPRPLTELDRLPFLYEEACEGGSIWELENKMIYYESGRGCPFRCSYCLSSIDKQVRLRNMGTVKRELMFFLEKAVPQVKFVDRTFNCNHDHAIAVWQFLKENDNGVTNFHFEIAADIINEDELELLNSLRPGLIQLEIGVQSTNHRTLEEINRYVDTEHLKQVVNRISRTKNIHIHLDLIAGLPYEDYDTFVNSFNEVYAMQPEQLQLGFLKILKGSKMHEKAGEYGIHYLQKPPYEVLYSKWLSYEDIRRLKSVEEMVEIYYNSSQFNQSLRVMVLMFPHPFAFYGQLAEFYERKGYFTSTPARAYRYQVLLGFAIEIDPEREALYKELLIYDMYLRENLKSRPCFATDQSAYKEFIHRFYGEEEEKRLYLKEYEGYQAKQLRKMTHMEIFSYGVIPDCHAACSYEKCEPYAVLFDYRRRDPLNNQAGTYRITLS